MLVQKSLSLTIKIHISIKYITKKYQRDKKTKNINFLKYQNII